MGTHRLTASKHELPETTVNSLAALEPPRFIYQDTEPLQQTVPDTMEIQVANVQRPNLNLSQVGTLNLEPHSGVFKHDDNLGFIMIDGKMDTAHAQQVLAEHQ